MSQSGRFFLRASASLLLAFVFLVNAVGAFPVKASSSASGQTQTEAASSAKSSFLERIRAWFQDEGDPTPTATSAPATDPPVTSTPTDTETPASTEELTQTPIPEPTETPTPTETATPSPTANLPTVDSSFLSFELSVSPEQAAPGEEVTFTVTITNKADTEVTELVFSDTLPAEFDNGQNGFGDFQFDPQTRQLTWAGSKTTPNSLAAGATLSLQYTVKVDSKLGAVQIKDVTSLTASGWSDPLQAQAVLTVVPAEKHMTVLSTKGGKAQGLKGRVSLEFPEGVLASNDVIQIEDQSESRGVTPDKPAVFFSLDKYTSVISSGKPASSTDETKPLTHTEAEFDQPVKLTVSLDGIADLNAIPAEKVPMLVTYVESSKTWMRMPLEDIDRENNTVTAEIKHFSGWGITFGSLWPQYGDNLVLFDSGYPSLFTGRSNFSIPIWTPPGRNGMAPSLALTYSSSAIDGILGYVQSPWVGIGWSLDTVEIVRKITNDACDPCGDQSGTNSFGYENKFTLLFNGTGGELIPEVPGGTNGRYHLKNENFLYIQLHNAQTDGQESPANVTGEWWEIVTKDGTQWRLGYTGTPTPIPPTEDLVRTGLYDGGSEQLAIMLGYRPNYGNWATLGYAGKANDVVAFRWRVDQVTDSYGNQMNFQYTEERGACHWYDNFGHYTFYDRASYLKQIDYTTSTNLAAVYKVEFILENRNSDVIIIRDETIGNWDSQRLDKVLIEYGGQVIRTYDLSFSEQQYTDSYPYHWVTKLNSVSISGTSTVNPIYTSVPAISFTYEDLPDRAPCYSADHFCDPIYQYYYPRLKTISNGWGGVATYEYESDADIRTSIYSWYNYRVKKFTVSDGMTGSDHGHDSVTEYSYSGICYDQIDQDGCDNSIYSSLVGFSSVTATSKSSSGIILGTTVHHFTVNRDSNNNPVYYPTTGSEGETIRLDPNGNPLSYDYTIYQYVSLGPHRYFVYPQWQDKYGSMTGPSVRVMQVYYDYETNVGDTLGNLKNKIEYLGGYQGYNPAYRTTHYDYLSYSTVGTQPVGMQNIMWQETVHAGDINGVTISCTQYGYDGVLPGQGLGNHLALTLQRIVGVKDPYLNSTLDTRYLYDAFGNRYETDVLTGYGIKSSPVSGNYVVTQLTFDNGTKTYVTSSTNARGDVTTTAYDYGLGLPTDVTDPNSLTSSTRYDGLGRTKTITYPGFAQPNVQYSYTSGAVQGTISVKMDVYDGTRTLSSWQISNGLGQVIQTQTPYVDSNNNSNYLVLTSSSTDSEGRLNTGQPVTLASAVGGTYYPPSWTALTHSLTTTTYDALGWTTRVDYYDQSNTVWSSETNSYSWSYGIVDHPTSTITHIDQNGHQTVHVNDELGRQVEADEYTGTNSNFIQYSHTLYTYYADDQLHTIKDMADNQTTISYDGFGRKSSMVDPDLGTWFYGYDDWGTGALGNLTSQMDARGCITVVTYDQLHRPKIKDYSTSCSPTSSVIFYYDNEEAGHGNAPIGHMIKMTDGSGSTNWSYNFTAGNQVVTETKTTFGISRSNTTTIDPFGRPLSQTLPNNELLQYTYHAAGLLSGMSGTDSYLSNIHYNAAGQAADQKLGNTLTQRFGYDGNTQRLISLCAFTGTQSNCNAAPSYYIFDLSYNYENNGNIHQITDAKRTETVTYTYDELNRLTTASGPYNQSFAYDALGNIQTKNTQGSTFLSVSAGGYHTCALTSAGGVKCWGGNSYGELGDGTTTQRTTPTDVGGLSSGVSALATGGNHTCVLTTAGGVKCWGKNSDGQLGDGTTTDRSTPVDVSGLTSGVIAIAAGERHTCALTTAGGVKCWGHNGYGQLGDGTTTSHTTPVAVSGLASGITAIALGTYHTCALTTAGGAKCWGYNSDGQLGDGTTTNRTAPVNVSGLGSGVSSVGAGFYHSCALTTAGGMKCWGYNGYGQLGDGTTTSHTTPVNVSGLTSGVSAIAVGDNFNCARTTSGGGKCWGKNIYGQVGDGTTTQRNAPVDVSGLTSGVSALTAKGVHTCALLSAGGLKCWGSNWFGELGDGRTTQRTAPVDVSGLTSGVSSLRAGNNHTCAVTTSGGAKCWGYNGSDQLGNGSGITVSAPADVSGLTSGVSAIAPGSYHSCALTTTGGVKCWGYNSDGQLGDGTTNDRATAVNVSGLTSGVSAVATGSYHSCALTTAGGVKCWGYNGYGQLGDGTTTRRTAPVDVSGLTSGVIAIAASGHHTCALTTAGAVKCWGENGYGQVGDGTTTNRTAPTAVSGLASGVTAIALGTYHTCARTSAGGVKCWGYNSRGGLGDGTTTYRTTPVNVSGLTSGVSGVSAGAYHTCALLTAGTVKCWGDNGYGQVGDGTTTQRTTPVAVNGLTGTASAIAVGGSHTCALMSTGGAKCWGYNTYGQLGDSTPIYQATPVVVTSSNLSATYTYNTVHKHAVASLSTGESYSYDANGNMTVRNENGLHYDQEFDAENRLLSVKINNEQYGTRFAYDGEGNLAKMTLPNGTYTLYYFGIYEVRYDSNNTQTGDTMYYPVGGAMRVNGTLYFALSDHLGSTSVVTNATGGSPVYTGYYPFGETRYSSSSLPTDRLYTGQQQNSYINLMNFRSRWYDAQLGRFISPDSIIPDGNPQSLNRYSYVNNDPINYNDPTGHCLVGNVWMPDTTGGCTGSDPTGGAGSSSDLTDYGVTVSGKWTPENVGIILGEVQQMSLKMYYDLKAYCITNGCSYGGNSVDLFNTVLNGTKVVLEDRDGPCVAGGSTISCGSATQSPGLLNIGPNPNALLYHQITAEFGHIFDGRLKRVPSNALAASEWIVGGERVGHGYVGGGLTQPGVHHLLKDPGCSNACEDFADMFMNYTYASFSNDLEGWGSRRYSWTGAGMGGWIYALLP